MCDLHADKEDGFFGTFTKEKKENGVLVAIKSDDKTIEFHFARWSGVANRCLFIDSMKIDGARQLHEFITGRNETEEKGLFVNVTAEALKALEDKADNYNSLRRRLAQRPIERLMDAIEEQTN